MLYEYKESENYTENSAFSLYDISGDNIPELIISENYYSTSVCRIYTWQDGLIDHGNQWGSNGTILYCPDTNVIISYHAGISSEYRDCYQFKNGVIQEIIRFSSNFDVNGNAVFSINDETVTEVEYQKSYENTITKAYKYLGRDFPIKESFIEAAVMGNTDWKQVYRNVLSECVNMESTFGVCFSLFDVTGDDIPELFLSPDSSHFAACHIFSFRDGLIGFGEYGCYGGINYHPEQKLFLYDDLHQGYTHGVYFTLAENGTYEKIIQYYNDVGAVPVDEDVVYTIDNKPVSKEEYNNILANYPKDRWKWLGYDYHASEEEIETALAEYNAK